MKKEYVSLKSAFDRYLSGDLSGEALKPFSAPAGIYQQKNGLFMVRVRVTGGEIDCKKLLGLAALLDRTGGYAHLTSRQDIQLHDIPADRVVEVVLTSDGLGLPFRGGGGNTYRNTVVGADSGLSVETVFDVYPYAHALNRALQGFDKAYALPRKFKVAFFGSERDLLRAAIHDLGYVAQIKGEEKGFRVFAGGGMGRESATGLCLIDFLPAKQLLQATFALISLFYDHGNRENRQQARLRFLVHRIGREAFLRLFLHYYVMTDVPKLSLRIPDTALPPDFILNAGKRVSPQMGDDPPYRRWKEIAVLPTRFHTAVKSVRLFVPYGNLAAAQLREIVKQVQRTGSPFVRLLITQDILIPFVSETLLPRLYANLKQALPGLDLTFASYRGHIVTCVGSTVCKIGMVDSPSVADCLAERLDRFLPADTPEKLALLRLAADDLRISGCPNACSGHPAARIGMGCINQKVNGMIQPYGRLFLGAGVTDGAPRLSTADGEGKPEPVKALIEVVMKKMTALVGLKGEAACPAAIREQTVPWS